MNNWPTFGTRYAEEVINTFPEYWESAVVAFIVLILWSIALIFLMRGRSRSQALLLVTSRPQALSQPKEYLPPKVFFPLSLLHTSIMTGIVIALFYTRGGQVDLQAFWDHALTFTGLFGLFIIISTIIYEWLTRTFGRDEQRGLWFPNHFLLIFIFGQTLYLPLVCLLFSTMSTSSIALLTLCLFILFRGWSVIRLLAIFNQLHHYPLHIILYLCACEIGPLLFLLNGSQLSK